MTAVIFLSDGCGDTESQAKCWLNSYVVKLCTSLWGKWFSWVSVTSPGHWLLIVSAWQKSASESETSVCQADVALTLLNLKLESQCFSALCLFVLIITMIKKCKKCVQIPKSIWKITIRKKITNCSSSRTSVCVAVGKAFNHQHCSLHWVASTWHCMQLCECVAEKTVTVLSEPS